MKVITIGRSSDNNVPVNDPKVSRHHLQIIQHDDGSYTLSDFGSTNGTYVNGKRVFGEIRLSPHDVVRVGNTTLPWKDCFVGKGAGSPISNPPDYTKTNTIPLALGLIGVVAIIVLVLVFVFVSNKNNGKKVLDPLKFKNGTQATESHDNSAANCISTIANNETPNETEFSGLDIIGEWEWRGDGGDLFYMHLYNQEDGRIVGTYETYLSEGRQDVSDNNFIKENRTKRALEENTILVEFQSGARGGKGTAVITKLSDNSIAFDGEDGEGRALVPMRTVILTKIAK